MFQAQPIGVGSIDIMMGGAAIKQVICWTNISIGGWNGCVKMQQVRIRRNKRSSSHIICQAAQILFHILYAYYYVFSQFLTLHHFGSSNNIPHSWTFHPDSQWQIPSPVSWSPTCSSTAAACPESFIILFSTPAARMLLMLPDPILMEVPWLPWNVLMLLWTPFHLLWIPPIPERKAWSCPRISPVLPTCARHPKSSKQDHQVLAIATVQCISSGLIGVWLVAVLGVTKLVLWFTGVAIIARCEVVHWEHSPTISIALANAKGVPGCSVFCMQAEAMIWFEIPATYFR